MLPCLEILCFRAPRYYASVGCDTILEVEPYFSRASVSLILRMASTMFSSLVA